MAIFARLELLDSYASFSSSVICCWIVISFSFASDYGTLISESGISEKEIRASVENYYSPILKNTPHQFYFFNRESLGDEESQKYDLFFADFVKGNFEVLS